MDGLDSKASLPCGLSSSVNSKRQMSRAVLQQLLWLLRCGGDSAEGKVPGFAQVCQGTPQATAVFQLKQIFCFCFFSRHLEPSQTSKP